MSLQAALSSLLAFGLVIFCIFVVVVVALRAVDRATEKSE
jgi:hypothetical protein